MIVVTWFKNVISPLIVCVIISIAGNAGQPRPKNQNRCWYNIGSPPPEGLKNELLKLRSVNNIVIPAASTGRDINNKKAVINTAQVNKGIKFIFIPGTLILNIVTIKLIAPNIEDIPAKWRLKIAKSTEASDAMALRGGYTVQPVPAPAPIILDESNNNNEGGNNRKLKLFNLGNAISAAPSIRGTNQLPKPPIIAGITIKNIITNACAVTTTL